MLFIWVDERFCRLSDADFLEGWQVYYSVFQVFRVNS